MHKIEIEFRTRFDEKEYKRLKSFLGEHARDLGEDDKNSHFFVFNNKVLKVVDEVSKNLAKIVLKLNRIGQRDYFPEIEIPITRSDVKKAVQIFNELNAEIVVESFQRRHNYLYKGVEIALKYSDNWGYHAEFEIVVDGTDSEVSRVAAKKQIRKVAAELGAKLMTNEEIKKFITPIEKRYKKQAP